MSSFRFLPSQEGDMVFDDVPSWLMGILGELPQLCGPHLPEKARERLFPSPTDDDEELARDWERMVHPDLFALLASSREIVLRDLAAARPPKGDREGWVLTIPAAHVNAWISALNTARLHLAAIHEVTSQDMEDPLPIAVDQRGIDLHKLDLFGLLQQLLVQAVLPDAEEEGGRGAADDPVGLA